jgi:hypothetical protein
MPDELYPTTFRVGVTGQRNLDADAIERLRARLEGVFHTLLETIVKADQHPHRHEAAEKLLLRLVSPLAEGSDRLIARTLLAMMPVAAQAGCAVELAAPLPFDRATYRASFSGGDASIAEFDQLLAAAGGGVLELDGAFAPDFVRHQSYAVVGRTVVRNCDLLIAIWDERSAADGGGGSGDTVNYARRVGVPVLRFDPDGHLDPEWLAPSKAPRHRASGDAAMRMRHYIVHLLRRPGHSDHRLPWPVALLFGINSAERDPLRVFLGEREESNRNIWAFHAALLRVIKPSAASSVPESDTVRHMAERPADDTGSGATSFNPFARQRWDTTRPVAARLAGKYQQRYKSAYLAILILSLAAVLIAIACVAAGHPPGWLIAVELAVLLSILAIWSFNEIGAWHGRYLEYRFLAEMRRPLMHLHAFARGASGPLASDSRFGRGPRWATWLYGNQARALAFPGGAFNKATVQKSKRAFLRDLVEPQIAFHRQREPEARAAERRLGLIGWLAFGATLCVVATKLVLHCLQIHAGLQTCLGIMGAALPSIAAFVFAVRAYEEFGVLANQSEAAVVDWRAIRDRVEAVTPGDPLASERLGSEVRAAAALLMDDVHDWTNIFEMKEIDPG